MYINKSSSVDLEGCPSVNLSSIHSLKDLSDSVGNGCNERCDCWKCEEAILGPEVRITERTFKKQKKRAPTLKVIKANNTENKANAVLTTMVTNCRSLFSKMTGLVQNYKTLDWNIALLTETWQSLTRKQEEDIILDHLENEHGLAFLGEPRKQRRGGGVAIVYEKKKLTLTKVKIQPPNFLELIVGVAKTVDPSAFPVQIVLCAYFKPTLSVEQIRAAIEYLQVLISDMTTKYGNCPVVFGSDRNKVNIDDILSIHPDFAILNSEPTRGRNCLDILVTNIPNFYELGENFPELGNELQKSDHRTVLFRRRELHYRSEKYKTINLRRTPESKIILFAKFIKDVNWEGLTNMDPDTIAITMDTVLSDGLNGYMPSEQKRVKADSKKWFTRELDSLRERRRKAFKKDNKSVEFKDLDKQYKSKLFQAKLDFRQKHLDNAINAQNIRGAFRALRILAGTEPDKSTFVLPGHEQKSEIEIANILAEFFSQISNEYPHLKMEDLPDRVRLKLSVIDENIIPQFSTQEIYEKLRKMKIPNSTVDGDLPPKVLKEIFLELSVPFTVLVNNCLKTCSFPDKYKLETVVVIAKINPPQSLDQLRNLGLTQFNGKFVESIIISLLKPYIKDDKGQFGGKKHTGTTNYLLELTEFILEAWDTNDLAVVMFCADFSKGFNRLHPARFITTLSDMGVPAFLIKIIMSYLTNRRMRVRHNGAMSNEHSLPGGAPQGGLLSIIIFCIYTSGCGMPLNNALSTLNELSFPEMPFDEPMRTEDEIRTKFVDDTSIAVKLKLQQILQQKSEILIPEYLFEEKKERELTDFEMNENRNAMHDQIQRVEQFTKFNFMKINESKSKILFFNNKKMDGTLDFECNGSRLEQTESMKVIGYMFQSNMRIDEQVKLMINKTHPAVWGLRKLMGNGATKEQGKIFYVSMVRSLMEVNVPVWNGRLSNKDIEQLEKIQKKCFKLILKNNYQSYENAKSTLSLESLAERRLRLSLNFVKKAAKHHPAMFPRQEQVRGTRLSAKNPLKVPKFKSEIHKNSGKVYLARLFNDHLETIPEQQKQELVTLKKVKKGRCGECQKCQTPNCGNCRFCRDMRQFGGNNKLKQACQERKCLNMK